MADSIAVCVACAKQTVSGQRQILGTMESSQVTEALHNMLCKRIGYDFDSSALSNTVVCMKCYKAYVTYSKKGKELYANTRDLVDHIKGLVCSYLCPIRSAEVMQSACKRSRVDSVEQTLSPTVSVSYIIK